MAIIYSYPLTTPKVKDLLIGTSVFDEDDENSPRNNPTVSFTIKSLLDMIGTGGFQTLQQVTNLGASTTNAITIANGLSVTGTFTDSSGGVGIAGQVLSSTNIGTAWVSDAGGTVKSVAATHAGNAFSASIGNVATVNPSVDITMNGITAQYVNGAGNLATLLDIPGLITSLTTNGTSGVSTLVGRVLNIPNYANTQNTLTTTGTGAATLVGTVLNIPTPVIPFTSLTTAGTSGASTLTAGVLNIPDYTGSASSVTKTGTPVAGEIAIFNAATVIEGDASYTIDSSLNVSQAADTNVKNTIGRAVIDGGIINNDFATFTHIDRQGALNYAFMASPSGSTFINATGASQTVQILDDNVSVAAFEGALTNFASDEVSISSYGSGTITGTPTYNLSVDSAGKIIETAINQTTNITVSAAQLSALNGSPITLLPAPGVGKTYHFNQIFLWFEAGSVAYNFGGMGTGIGFISVTGLFGSAYSSLSDMDSASSSMVNQGRNFNYMNIDPATANAAAILTSFQGTNPNPTQGNGILYISISYQIKDLGPTIQAN